jgi:hypothetical protein
MQAEKKYKPFCLLITPDTHTKIEKAIKKTDMTKCSWIREAINAKFKATKK